MVQGDEVGLERLGDGGAVIEVDEDLALPQRRSLLDDPHGPAVVLIIVAAARGIPHGRTVALGG